jgi:hypothetical protein
MHLSVDQLEAVERWFVARGVPHFTAGYSATEDVLTRALPVLTLAFLASAVAAIDLDWPTIGILTAIIGGFALLLGGWAALNRIRGRRILAPPQRVGATEIAAFLLIPSVLPLVFGGDWRGVALTLLSQAVVLVAVYLATSYGIVAIAKWSFLTGITSLRQTVALLARGLPLLLLGFMFLFVNAEAWQSAGRLEEPLLVAVFGLFAAIGTVFVLFQIPRELRRAAEFATWSDVAGRLSASPLEDVTADQSGRPDPPPLSRREWGNLGLVVLVAQGFRILVVALLVGAFFVLFGLLMIRPETIEVWIGTEPTSWWQSFTWFGVDVQLTRELVQVSAFLAAFAGLYFSVYMITDATFREEFFEDIVDEARENLAVRAAYRAALDAATAA